MTGRTGPADYAYEIPYLWGSQQRVAVLFESTLRSGVEKRGFKSAAAEVGLLVKPQFCLVNPVARYRGLKRGLMFKGEVDWYSGQNMHVLICNPIGTYIWGDGELRWTPPPIRSVFTAYLHARIALEVRERWRNDHKLAGVPHAEVCGFEWVLADAADPRLPEDHATRFDAGPLTGDSE